jgi:hypothetical protein
MMTTRRFMKTTIHGDCEFMGANKLMEDLA